MGIGMAAPDVHRDAGGSDLNGGQGRAGTPNTQPTPSSDVERRNMVKGNGFLVLGLTTAETIELVEAGTNKLIAELSYTRPATPCGRPRMAFRAPRCVSIIRKPRQGASGSKGKGGSKCSQHKGSSEISLAA